MATDKIKQDLTIELKFETEQWKRQTSSASKDLDELNQRFKTTAKSTEKATKKGQEFGRAMQFIVGLGIAQYMKNTALELDRVSNRMKFATDTVEDFGRAMEFSANTANELGLALVPTQRGLATLQASAKGTSLAGKEIEELFTGISQASGALSLTADETNSVFLAFSQIISKGKVQAEELRSQIGERIPGALKLAERALGVTGAELDKLLQSGSLTADDLLPKLAREFQKTFGDQAQKNTQSLTAQLNKIQNSLKIISAEAFKWAEDTFKVLEGYNKIAEAIEARKIAEKSNEKFQQNTIDKVKEGIAQNEILRQQGKITDAEFQKRTKKQIDILSERASILDTTEDQLKEIRKLWAVGRLDSSDSGTRTTALSQIADIALEYAQNLRNATLEQQKLVDTGADDQKEFAKNMETSIRLSKQLAEINKIEDEKREQKDREKSLKLFGEIAEDIGKKQKEESRERIKELNAERKAIREKISLLKQAQTVDDANQVNFLQSITAGSNKDIRLSIEARTRGLGATAGDVDVAQRNAEELEEQTRLLKNIDEKLDVERA